MGLKIGSVKVTVPVTGGTSETATADIELGWIKVILTWLTPGVIAGIVAALPYFGLEAPSSKAERERVSKIHMESVLRDVLSVEDPAARSRVLRFVIDAGFLDDENETLRGFTTTPDSVPLWPKATDPE